jgi:SAM-dependent methyltransferase
LTSAYAGRYAALYDTFYRDKDYAGEARFVDGRLRAAGAGPPARVLETACGTGGHALALATLGYQVVATDGSEEMLAVARVKAAGSGSGVRFLRQDMLELDLADPPFDAALCLFDSIGYVRTPEAVREALGRLRRHVRADGVLIVEFWHAPAMTGGFEPVRVRRWTTPQGQVVRISETSLDRERQLAVVDYSVYELRDDGTYVSTSEQHVNRFFTVAEMAELLAASGWAPRSWFAGYDTEATLDERTWHVVCVSRALAP